MLIEEVTVCSLAHNRGTYQQEVQVGAQSSRSVPFVVVFTRDGDHSIEVRATVKGSSLNDGVRRSIQVLVSKHAVSVTTTKSVLER